MLRPRVHVNAMPETCQASATAGTHAKVLEDRPVLDADTKKTTHVQKLLILRLPGGTLATCNSSCEVMVQG